MAYFRNIFFHNQKWNSRLIRLQDMVESWRFSLAEKKKEIFKKYYKDIYSEIFKQKTHMHQKDILFWWL